MNGLSWLNDLMVWLARWVPRVVLIKATHAGVLFGPRGRVSLWAPGLWIYWPIVQELALVSKLARTMEIAAQMHGREAIQLVVTWQIVDPLKALTTLNDVAANIDDRAQAALAWAYRHQGDDLAAAARQRLRVDLMPSGIEVIAVDVSQRGPIVALRMLSDWATHESRAL